MDNCLNCGSDYHPDHSCPIDSGYTYDVEFIDRFYRVIDLFNGRSTRTQVFNTINEARDYIAFG